LELTNVIAEIDAEIAKHQAQIEKLQQAKTLLSGPPAPKSGRGRPKGSKNMKSATVAAPPKPAKAKRNLTPEGREKIAAAMKRRWAKQRGEVS
jgi:hypothetical protein